jgi:DNA-binding MarR family transcriptional regulator
MPDDVPEARRLSLLFQLYRASTESRRFMRLALRDTGMTGEEYGIYSYFYANGARTLSRASADLGYAVTTLASLLAPAFDRGELARSPHPVDGRSRLIELSPAGRTRLMGAAPAYSKAYEALLARLGEADADVDALSDALETLRSAVARTNELIEGEMGPE